MEFLERIKTIVESLDRAKVKQTCWVWCPTCRNELTADDESLYHYEMGLVVYGCAECGTVSKWDLRDAPAPLLIESKEPR